VTPDVLANGAPQLKLENTLAPPLRYTYHCLFHANEAHAIYQQPGAKSDSSEFA